MGSVRALEWAASVTVNTEKLSHSYKPGGAMLPEPLGFPYLDPTAITVTVIAETTGLPTVLAPDFYELTGAGPSGTGTIRALTLWPPNDEWHVRRRTPLLQRAEIAPGQPLPSKDVEQSLDRITMGTQEARRAAADIAERSLQVPLGEVASTIPPAAVRAGQFLAFDAIGRPVPAIGTGAGDLALRSDLAAADGAALIGYDAGGTIRPVQDKLRDITRTIFDVATPGEQILIGAGLIDLSVYIERMKAIGGRWRIPDLGYQYTMATRISEMPARFVLLFDGGCDTIFTGVPTFGVAQGLFESTADGTQIACYDRDEKATFRSQTPSSRFWLHDGIGITGMRTRGVRCVDMKVQIARPGDDAAVLAGDLATAPRNAAAFDWECVFTGRDANGAEGAVMHYYAQRGRCFDGQATRVGSGYQAWGGNADFSLHGTPSSDPVVEAARLKCRDILVQDIVCEDCTNTFVFLCMVQGGTVRDCIGDKAWDVGFDAEGCRNVTFERCTGQRAVTAVMSVYFFAENVVFLNCTATSPDAVAYPRLFATINPAQLASFVPGASIIGGRYECTEAAGGFATVTVGAMTKWHIERAEFVQACILGSANGLHDVSVVGNRFRVARRASGPFTFVTLGPSINNLGNDAPKVRVEHNSYSSLATQPAGTRLAYLASAENNVTPDYVYAGNRVADVPVDGGGFAGLHISWSGVGSVGFHVRVLDNGGRGHPITYKREAGATSDPVIITGPRVDPAVPGTMLNTNFNSDGTTIVPLAA